MYIECWADAVLAWVVNVEWMVSGLVNFGRLQKGSGLYRLTHTRRDFRDAYGFRKPFHR